MYILTIYKDFEIYAEVQCPSVRACYDLLHTEYKDFIYSIHKVKR